MLLQIGPEQGFNVVLGGVVPHFGGIKLLPGPELDATSDTALMSER